MFFLLPLCAGSPFSLCFSFYLVPSPFSLIITFPYYYLQFLTDHLAGIHCKKKDGGCTFYHNTLRTKLSPLGIWKDMDGSRSNTNRIALVEFE